MPRSPLRKLLDNGVVITGKGDVAPPGFDAKKIIGDSPRLRKMDRLSQYAVAAAKLALESAKLSPPQEAGVVISTLYGPINSTREFLQGVTQFGPHLASAFIFPNTVMNMVTGMVSIEFGLKGPSATMVGEIDQAIGYAADLIKNGRASVMLAGYVEEENEIIQVKKSGAMLYVLESKELADKRGVSGEDFF